MGHKKTDNAVEPGVKYANRGIRSWGRALFRLKGDSAEGIHQLDSLYKHNPQESTDSAQDQ